MLFEHSAHVETKNGWPLLWPAIRIYPGAANLNPQETAAVADSLNFRNDGLPGRIGT
jgi:hypothetical protein